MTISDQAKAVKRLLRAFPGSTVQPVARPTKPSRTPEPDGRVIDPWETPPPPSPAVIRARIARMPKCQRCRRPLTMGQPGIHYSCRNTTAHMTQDT